MKIHIYSVWIGLAAIAVSICVIYAYSKACVQHDIALALLGSAAFVVMSSEISYRSLEKKTYDEYYWRLTELRHKAWLLDYIASQAYKEDALTWSDVQDYCDVLGEINAMISGYFATCDREYRCKNRKKIKLLRETNDTLLDVYSKKSFRLENEIGQSFRNNVPRDASASVDKYTLEIIRRAHIICDKKALYEYLQERVTSMDEYH